MLCVAAVTETLLLCHPVTHGSDQVDGYGCYSLLKMTLPDCLVGVSEFLKTYPK